MNCLGSLTGIMAISSLSRNMLYCVTSPLVIGFHVMAMNNSVYVRKLFLPHLSETFRASGLIGVTDTGVTATSKGVLPAATVAVTMSVSTLMTLMLPLFCLAT